MSTHGPRKRATKPPGVSFWICAIVANGVIALISLFLLLSQCCGCGVYQEEVQSYQELVRPGSCDYQTIKKCVDGCNNLLVDCISRCPGNCGSWIRLCKRMVFINCMVPCWPEE